MKAIVCWMWSNPNAAAHAGTVLTRRAPLEAPQESIDARKLRERQARLAIRYPSRPVPPAPRPVRLARPLGPVIGSQKLPRLFDAEQVNTLQRMCLRHLREPHQFWCISDSPIGLHPDVRWLATPPEASVLASIGSPEGAHFPSCYRRLWVFSEAARILGTQILCMDVDAVIVGDLAPLFDRPEDFVGWRPFRDWGTKLRFGGGTYLLRPGTRTWVWEQFAAQPERAIAAARTAGYRGSDQAWMSYCLAGKEAYWPRDCGIYSVRDLGPEIPLPADARLVHFNGHAKPQHYVSGQVAPVQWVLDNWK